MTMDQREQQEQRQQEINRLAAEQLMAGLREQERQRQQEEAQRQVAVNSQPPPTPAPAPTPEPTPVPSPPQTLKGDERGFTPKPDWKPVEHAWDASKSTNPTGDQNKTDPNKPTVFEDKQGNRFYGPNSTMWDIGFREGGRRDPITGQITVPQDIYREGVYSGLGGSADQNYITIQTDKGELIHITQSEAKALDKLKGEDKFNELETMGIITKGSMYVKGAEKEGDNWSYIKPEGVKAMKEAEKENYQARKEYAEYQKSSPLDKFKILVKQGRIPSDAEFKGVNKAGDVEYQTKATTLTGNQQFHALVTDGSIPAGAEFIGINAKGEIEYYSPETVAYQKASPEEKFNMLVADGSIPKGSEFKGENKDGEIEYTPPPGNALKEKIANLGMGERIPLTQYHDMYFAEKGWDSDRTEMVRDLNKASGHENIEKAKATLAEFDKHLFEAQDAYKKQFGGGITFATEVGMTGAENLVPFVGTARYWGDMTVKDKVISLGVDTASVVLMLWGGRVIGAAGKQLSGETKLIKMAARAGDTGRALEAARVDYESVLTSKIRPKTQAGLVELSNKVESARIAAKTAHKEFLSQLEKANAVSSSSLKKIEAKSGLTGFSSAIQDIGAATKNVLKAWKAVDKKPISIENTPKAIEANKASLKALDNLQVNQVKLETALDKANSVLKPRYSGTPPAAEFKGFKATWEKADPKIIQHQQKILDDMQKWVDTTAAKTKPGNIVTAGKKAPVIEATKPMEVKATAKLKLTAEYAEVKPKTKLKTKTPVVTREKPAIFTKGKYAPKESAIPSEAYGRMTREQIARQYGTENLNIEAVRSRTIEESLIANKLFTTVKSSEWQQIRELVETGNKAAVKAETKAQIASMTATETQTKVNEAVKEAVQQATQTRTATQPATLTKAMVKTITNTILKTRVEKLQKKIIRIPLPRGGGGGTDKEKRKAIKESLGAITYRRGELGGKDVFHTWAVDRNGEMSRVITLGPPPAGATVHTGKGSTITTLKKIRGKILPNVTIHEDTGASDTIITSSNSNLSIANVGNVIGDRTPPISQRPPRISPRMPRISPRMPRITPKMPKLR